MSIVEIISLALKILVTGLLIVGLFNEERLANWEEKLFAAIRRRLSKGRESARRQKELTVLPARAHSKWAS